MSYWALTVITNLMTVIPVIGLDVLCSLCRCPMLHVELWSTSRIGSHPMHLDAYHLTDTGGSTVHRICGCVDDLLTIITDTGGSTVHRICGCMDDLSHSSWGLHLRVSIYEYRALRLFLVSLNTMDPVYATVVLDAYHWCMLRSWCSVYPSCLRDAILRISHLGVMVGSITSHLSS